MKLPYLDSVRALAALFVFFSHAYLLRFGGVPQSVWSDILLYPHLAVEVFITLSGFCLGYAALHRQATYGQFIQRRCWRILPAYYGAMLVSGLIFLGCFSYGHNLPLRAIAVNGLLLADLYPKDILYFAPPFWTIGIEFRLYFLFPLFLWVYQKVGTLLTIATAIAVAGLWFLIAVSLAPDFVSRWHYTGLFFPVLFVLGLLASQSPGSKGWGLWGLGSVAALVLVLAQNLITNEDGYSRYLATLPLVDLLMGLVSASLLAVLAKRAIAKQRHWALDLLSWQPLANTARWSYSLYLLHYPLLRVANLALENMGIAGWPAILFVSLPVLGCCYLFSLVFEHPFLSRKMTNAAIATQAAKIL